jgi:hypothetical protein
MKKLLLLLPLILIISGCTTKAETCDLVDSAGSRAVRYQQYMNDLDGKSHYELSTWLVEQENSIKGLRLGQTTECVEFKDSETIQVNGKTYKLLYNRLSSLSFEIGFEIENSHYWYTRE